MWKKEAYIWEPWDLMNNRVVSSLGFLFILCPRLGAEASDSLERPTGTDKKQNKTLQKTCLISQRIKKDTI